MGSLFAHIKREIKFNGHLQERSPSPVVNDGFRIYNDFFGSASRLRQQFEERMSSAIEANDGLTPLLYAYCRDTYQFLTASSERIFSTELLDELLETMRKWAGEILDASHVSTPQLRVFVEGCYRDFLRDDVEAGHHWILWLCPNDKQKAGRITLSTENVTADAESASMSVDHLASFDMKFNQLLVHDASNAYGIKPAKTSMDPALAAVFLDGYFW